MYQWKEDVNMSIANIDEKVLQKIQKALNLANAKDDHESHTAMLLAQQLMAKHGLEMGDINVDGDNSKPKEVMEMYATPKTKLQWWQKDLAGVVAKNFRCFTFWRSFYQQSRIVFLGLKEDTMIAREVFVYAQDAIKYFSIQYLDREGVEGISMRTKVQNDYIQGFINGLRDRFREQVDANEWGLILVKDDAVIERHDNMKFKKDSGSSASRSWDSGAMSAGYNDGKNMDHTKKVLKG